MHPGQLAPTAVTVRALVDRQFPRWRGLAVRAVSTEGTVNALFRLGERLAARLPLVPGDVEGTRRWLEAEARAAELLVGRTRFPTPEPVALGEPGPGYPLPWSVQTWLPGTVATADDPGGSVGFARDLADLIGDLRAIDTGGQTFAGRGRTGRGGNLSDHDAWVQTCLDRSRSLLDVTLLGKMWAGFRELPALPGGDRTTHGDLMPGNLLVRGSRLASVLDVGGVGPADPALDLVAAWHLLEDRPRRVLREAIGADDLEWARGAAWAYEQALGLVWYYRDSNPTMSRIGRRTLERMVADPPGPA